MKTLIIGNWKMNPQTIKEAKKLFNSLNKNLKNIKNVEVVICPTFLFIPQLKTKISNLKIGAQNCFYEERGAFTGEVSVSILKDFGCKYILIGHSERRQYFGETDEMINKKIKMVLKMNLRPILCIGETKEQRKKGKTFEVLKKQLQKDLKGIEKMKNLIIAYEPVWAIGSGDFCSPEKAKEVLNFLRNKFKKNPILYGGSVDFKNSLDFIKMGFNGLLIGGVSLKIQEFTNIIKNAK